MVQLTPEERAAIDELVECVAEAMARLEEVNPTYANKTKLQKLLYLAIDGFEIPITYSWYLAGAVIPSDAATPGTLQTAFDTLPSTDSPSIPETAERDVDTDVDETPETDFQDLLSASPEDLIGAADSRQKTDELSLRPETEEPLDPILFSAGPTADDTPEQRDAMAVLTDRHDEVCDFYESVLPEVWKQSTMRFLQNFYLEHAPYPYQDLYVQSTHLRTRLRDVEHSVKDHIQGTEPARSVPEIVRMIGRDVSDLHYTIRSSEALAATFNGVVQGTDSMEDGLMMLAQLDPHDLTSDHLAVVERMQEFFYYYVWRYPCLVISGETATGPSAQALRASRQRRLADFEGELTGERERFERELANAGLLPDYTDYPSQDDELGTEISSLAEQYLN